MSVPIDDISCALVCERVYPHAFIELPDLRTSASLHLHRVYTLIFNNSLYTKSLLDWSQSLSTSMRFTQIVGALPTMSSVERGMSCMLAAATREWRTPDWSSSFYRKCARVHVGPTLKITKRTHRMRDRTRSTGNSISLRNVVSTWNTWFMLISEVAESNYVDW